MAATLELLAFAQSNFLQNRPRAVLYQAVAQPIANATWTATTFDSNLLDNYGGHSNSTNNSRYTSQVAGWYSVSGGGGWVTAASGTGRGANIYKNGAFYQPGAVVVGSSGAVHVTPIAADVYLAVNDYVELWVWQNTGGSLSTNGPGQYSSYMSVRWEGN